MIFYTINFSELKRRLKQENKAKEKEAKETLKAQQSTEPTKKSNDLNEEENIDPNVTKTNSFQYEF